jgi:hypothetical protein
LLWRVLLQSRHMFANTLLNIVEQIGLMHGACLAVSTWECDGAFVANLARFSFFDGLTGFVVVAFKRVAK